MANRTPTLARFARRASLAWGTLSVLAASVATLAPCTARAQGKSPIQAAPPNVLLLVDTSGSMERMPNGTMPVCTPGVAGQDPNRWGSIVQGLTGSVQPFWSCGRMHRDGTAPTGDDMNRASFLRAYWETAVHGALAPQAQYDDGYGLPHHRPLSGTGSDACGVFPDLSEGTLPGYSTRVFDTQKLATYPWKPNGSGYYNFPNGSSNNWKNPSAASGSKCVFEQNDDGQIDAASSYARFGLMTFDNDSGFGTGEFMGGVHNATVAGLNLVPAPLKSAVGGGWTFLYSNSTSAGQTEGVSESNRNAFFPMLGRITGCSDDIPMAVGARNQHAPSWEGPFVEFPSSGLNPADLPSHNAKVQTAILAARPYGGTPIAGMMASAYDYLLRWGASDSANPPKLDPYVAGGCRDQFVVLLTDGAPNLDLRTRELCSAGVAGNIVDYGGTPGTTPEATTPNLTAFCPFYHPQRTAARLKSDVPGSMRPISTIVVGFAVGHDTTVAPSVANDGFPGPVVAKTCAAWRASVTTSQDLANACKTQFDNIAGTPATAAGLTAWESTSARACCELNDIALAGSTTVPPQGAYFAESEGDLIGVFAEVLGAIGRQTSTRAVPVYSSAATIGTGASAITQSSTFVPSFQADPARTAPNQFGNTSSSHIWTGQLQRTRDICTGGAAAPVAITQAAGDDYQHNLQASLDRDRYFFTAVPEKVGGHIDANESVRPYGATLNDGVVQIGGVETILTRAAVGSSSTFQTALGSSSSDVEDLFDVDNKFCKDMTLSGGVKLKKLTSGPSCARVMWGFATAATPADLPDSSNGVVGAYAARCPIGGGQGQTADVKACRSLGAIIHSSPAIAGPPASLLRDEGYRKFSDLFANRKHALYVESTDGLLHAFDVNYPGRAGSTTTGELWAFVPPAVLPELKTNFPGGQVALLDGSPVVKDVVFERSAAQVGSDIPWHTALVAGLGHDGYFALDVTADGQIPNATAYVPVTDGNINTLNTGVLRSAAKPPGPHFLWQLTTTEAAGGSEKGKKKGKKKKGDDKKKDKKNKNNVELYGLFGDRVGTPAITTVFINDPSDPTGDSKPHEIGVAILPGGIDSDVPTSSSAPSCPRRSTTTPYAGGEAVMNPRTNVRGWSGNCADAVAGRSVTIVRLDNGRIIRHFARALPGDDDVPRRLLGGGDSAVCPAGGGTACRVINSPFDAPVTGTPVVFPNDPGSIGQKVFVGDADGTLFRMDISNPDPGKWKAELFLDTRGTGLGVSFTGDKPIAVPPVVSLGEKGSLIINVANGDQEDLGTIPANDHHVVWSVTEVPGASGARPQLNWFLPLDGGERVTGPMVVFDKTLNFSSYRVNSSANVCQDGQARIYALDYVKPKTAGNLADGGDWKIPGLPTNTQFSSEGIDLIPGVSVRASQACAQAQTTQDYFGGARMGAMLTTPTSYELVANRSKPNAVAGQNAVTQFKKSLSLPRTQTIVDAWASVVE